MNTFLGFVVVALFVAAVYYFVKRRKAKKRAAEYTNPTYPGDKTREQ